MRSPLRYCNHSQDAPSSGDYAYDISAPPWMRRCETGLG